MCRWWRRALVRWACFGGAGYQCVCLYWRLKPGFKVWKDCIISFCCNALVRLCYETCADLQLLKSVVLVHFVSFPMSCEQRCQVCSGIGSWALVGDPAGCFCCFQCCSSCCCSASAAVWWIEWWCTVAWEWLHLCSPPHTQHTCTHRLALQCSRPCMVEHMDVISMSESW